MRALNFSSVLILFVLLSACSDSSPTNEEPPPESASYQTEMTFPELSFDNPLDLQHPGDGSNRLFVVEQQGVINVFDNEPSASSSAVFLNLQTRVTAGGERGLLGLAFHPNFKSNGFFYVNYTAPNPLRTVISRFQVSAENPEQADLDSETIILSYIQPFSNHNGGQIQFGPDGFLYIAAGDGGGGGDPQENAQDRTNILGNILRIDVDATQGNLGYAIPATNPFADNDQGFREEIFAYGLRNPFRFSFDAANGDLWVADVGQNRFEEIDLVQNGDNLGWDITEGNACFEPMEGCDRTGLVDPIFDYQQDGSQSITGGFVYRGLNLPELTGQYIYADFISGRIWALDITDLDSPEDALLIDTDLRISSFGTDANNDLFFTAFDGNIYRIVEEE
jgi:glucose/arabinose dehydrogenase